MESGGPIQPIQSMVTWYRHAGTNRHHAMSSAPITPAHENTSLFLQHATFGRSPLAQSGGGLLHHWWKFSIRSTTTFGLFWPLLRHPASQLQLRTPCDRVGACPFGLRISAHDMAFPRHSRRVQAISVVSREPIRVLLVLPSFSHVHNPISSHQSRMALTG